MIEDAHLSLAEAIERLPIDRRVLSVLRQEPAIDVQLYMPIAVDDQAPHDRDEIYIVAAGSGTLRLGEEWRGIAAGDLVHVPAHVPHRFEHFDIGFAVWAIFYGPPRSVPA